MCYVKSKLLSARQIAKLEGMMSALGRAAGNNNACKCLKTLAKDGEGWDVATKTQLHQRNALKYLHSNVRGHMQFKKQHERATG